MKNPGRFTAVIAFAVLVSGCGDNVIGPKNQLEVTNVTDSFQWQVTALDDVSQTLTYTWANTGTSANVNQATSITGGTATLILTDAAGVEVFRKNLRENGTFATGTGTAGGWTIRIVLDEVGGTLNFRAQKP